MSGHKHRSRKHSSKRRSPPGSIPGTLSADPESPPPVISLIAFGCDDLIEQTLSSPAEIAPLLGRQPVTWVNVDGLGDANVISEIGALFNLHQLALEDVLHVHQRAKVEDYGEYLFIVVRMVEICDGRVQTEQVSIFLGKDFLITFQERPGIDSIEPVRQRLRGNRGKIRTCGAGYLAYSLIDAVIDGYFPILEHYGDRLDDLEGSLGEHSTLQITGPVHEIKSDLLVIRRAIWPHREAISALMRDPSPLIDEETRVYVRDCYDHVVQLIDIVETYRELGADLRDLYLATVSTRMNEIMKVLTVISTIFIPLTFIAGVYGMNFNTERSRWNMPELNWYYGYPFSLLLMVLTTLAMLLFFYRRGWVGPSVTKTDRDEPTADGSEQSNKDARGS